MMWPRLVANKILGKSGCEPFNTDGRDTESEAEDEDVAPLPLKTPSPRPSLLSSASNSPPSPFTSAKPPKTPSPSASPASSPSSITNMPSRKLERMKSESLWTDYVDTEEYKVFVGTWNVAGKTPPDDLDLNSWLNPNNPSDIYVIGFQEIVPLKAGNVFGSEDMAGPAAKWDELIRKTLNKTSIRGSSIARSSSAPSSMFLEALNSLELDSPIAKDDISLSKESSHGSKSMEEELELFYQGEADDESGHDDRRFRQRKRFRRVASKQMVGIFISIWVRADLRRHIRDLRVCLVGCGIMGCLGNKGSISVSLSLHETSFCFVCAHLASGQKEGDELHRNSDVAEILRRTIFRRSSPGQSPKPIVAHDRIVWFGDLNYRLALSDGEIRSFIEKEDWNSLLKSDQLRMELSAGRTFEGWHEGPIYFPPTYKYIPNSAKYCGAENKQGEKRRSPAWCDRILWYGKGLKQLTYAREEFTLSDHRPVKAIYLAEVEILSNQKVKKSMGLSTKVPEMRNILTREIQKLSKSCHEGMIDSLQKINSESIGTTVEQNLPVLNEVQAKHNLELGTMLNRERNKWEKEHNLKTRLPISVLTTARR